MKAKAKQKQHEIPHMGHARDRGISGFFEAICVFAARELRGGRAFRSAQQPRRAPESSLRKACFGEAAVAARSQLHQMMTRAFWEREGLAPALNLRSSGGGVPLEWADVERKTEKQWDVRKGRWRGKKK